jgi:tetratricopeptide (TPR) repeat protein
VPAAPTPAGGDLATNPKYAGAVKPIEETLKAAAKVMELFDKEMAKPEKERNVERANGYKLNAAGMYVKAALQAKMAAGRFSKAEDKTPILDAYGKPNIDKAVGIYMDMAAAAEAKKDFRTALAYYKKVLDIDPQNTQAQDAAKKLLTDHPEAMKGGGKAGPVGGGGDNPNDPTAVPDPSMQKTWKQNPTGKTDYGHIGR